MFVVTRPGAHWMRFLTLQRVRSTMRVPIRSKDRPIGGIAFMSRQPDCFDDEDGVAASRIADQLALALAHQELARHAIEDDRRHRRFAALEAVLPRLAVLEDLDDIAVAVSGVANGILQHDAVGVMVIHADGAHVHGLQDGVHRLTASAPTSFVEEQFKSLMPGGSLRIRSLELLDEARSLVKQRVVGPNGDVVREVAVPPSHAQALKALGVRSELRVAVRQGDELLGLLLFASRVEDHFTEEDEAIARRMADRVSLRLAQERIEGEARRAREASARAVEASARAAELEGRVEQLQRELERFSAHRAIGRSAAWKKALGDAAQVAATDTTVLVTGESGTGKEVIARYIHRGSKRAKGPFVALNCAALPEQLLESELFGHERGAFTGAHEARAGKIEQALGGVLFLDEVGDVACRASEVPAVLQEREFQRVGGSKTIKADVRIVSATNRDPRAGIQNGTFREDLYYRLGVFEIHLPPLRERPRISWRWPRRSCRRSVRGSADRPPASRKKRVSSSSPTPGPATCAGFGTPSSAP
ncbi:MAG: sigma 54-interacting transcriptional regulator [Candidatus Eisenbacteria bacterium]